MTISSNNGNPIDPSDFLVRQNPQNHQLPANPYGNPEYRSGDEVSNNPRNQTQNSQRVSATRFNIPDPLVDSSLDSSNPNQGVNFRFNIPNPDQRPHPRVYRRSNSRDQVSDSYRDVSRRPVLQNTQLPQPQPNLQFGRPDSSNSSASQYPRQRTHYPTTHSRVNRNRVGDGQGNLPIPSIAQNIYESGNIIEEYDSQSRELSYQQPQERYSEESINSAIRNARRVIGLSDMQESRRRASLRQL
ncbi:MAG: hypothetical protein ACKO47_02520 [Alphaproteobacteria bacterium]